MPMGDSIVCPQPLCNRCSNRRDSETKPLYNSKQQIIGWKYFCDNYPDGVPSKCVDVKKLFVEIDDPLEICQHFKRGAPKRDKPSKTA